MRKTILNAAHHELGAKMAPFAGWEMPIQYPTGILAEHRAVRAGAGLFDVSHMSCAEVSGPYALQFLDTLLTNCGSRLDPGQAQYTSMLTPGGTHIDDLFLYCLERGKFMVVANAANAEKVFDWIQAVHRGKAVVDLEMPGEKLEGLVEIRDLRAAGTDSRVDLALQGPLSLRILQDLAKSASDREALKSLTANAFCKARIADVEALVARTGYTGEKIAFEIFIHPDSAPALWHTLLKHGRPLGLLPCGLGARDSTRIEAGLPLFGHELEGPLGISITEAGYGFAVRSQLPFFIGRDPYIARAAESKRHLLRLQGQGRKTLRPGHVILDAENKIIGEVTSFAYTHEDKNFIVLACVNEEFQPQPGARVIGARLTREKISGAPAERQCVELTALARFPTPEERDSWPERYDFMVK